MESGLVCTYRQSSRNGVACGLRPRSSVRLIEKWSGEYRQSSRNGGLRLVPEIRCGSQINPRSARRSPLVYSPEPYR
eukprot:scaffold13609_cov72-Phaeocystis_antarctica.AAC.2